MLLVTKVCRLLSLDQRVLSEQGYSALLHKEWDVATD